MKHLYPKTILLLIILGVMSCNDELNIKNETSNDPIVQGDKILSLETNHENRTQSI